MKPQIFFKLSKKSQKQVLILEEKQRNLQEEYQFLDNIEKQLDHKLLKGLLGHNL